MTASKRRIYLDHNASAPLLPEARDAVIEALESVGNPSSVHAEGRVARSLIEDARRHVAALVGGSASHVVFTSGASEAAATCLTPEWTSSGRSLRFPRLAVLETDHPCIREGGRFDPSSVRRLPVDRDGIIDFDALRVWCDLAAGGLLALSVANSETGIIQPAREIAALARQAGVAVVFDVVQMTGRVPIDLGELGADALILSGHKMGAPKGVGAFVLADKSLRPAPLITGGAQETRQRAGTEPVPLISAFGRAAQTASRRLADVGTLLALRGRLEAGLVSIDPELVIIGLQADRLPQTVAIHHHVMRADTVQIAMDLEGLAVSAGSACSSGKLGASHVLQALEKAGATIKADAGALRVSFGFETEAADIEQFLAAFRDHWSRMRRKVDRQRAA